MTILLAHSYPCPRWSGRIFPAPTFLATSWDLARFPCGSSGEVLIFFILRILLVEDDSNGSKALDKQVATGQRPTVTRRPGNGAHVRTCTAMALLSMKAIIAAQTSHYQCLMFPKKFFVCPIVRGPVYSSELRSPRLSISLS